MKFEIITSMILSYPIHLHPHPQNLTILIAHTTQHKKRRLMVCDFSTILHITITALRPQQSTIPPSLRAGFVAPWGEFGIRRHILCREHVRAAKEVPTHNINTHDIDSELSSADQKTKSSRTNSMVASCAGELWDQRTCLIGFD